MRELNQQQIALVSGAGIGGDLVKLGGRVAGGGASVIITGFSVGRDIGKAAVKKIRSLTSG